MSQREHISVDPNQLVARYFRVTLKDLKPSPELAVASTDPQLEIENAVAIPINGTRTSYPVPGRCIYCPATVYEPGTNAPPAEEHIIAEGLGGTLVMPEASCKACEAQTSLIERRVLRDMLWAPRARMGIRGKKKKNKPTAFPLTRIVDGNDVTSDFPINQHPTVLFLCEFQPPRMLELRSYGEPSVSGAWVHTLGNNFELIRKADFEEIASPAFDTVVMSQMLAKIAHGFAVAQLGLATFRPLLLELIQRRFEKAEQCLDCFDLVGGAGQSYRPGEELHTIGYAIVPRDVTRYVVVTIRLFANIGAPVYRVVVGEML